MVARVCAGTLLLTVFLTALPAYADTNFNQILSDLERQYQIPQGCLAKIARAESGGRANARNPSSSASGMFQWLTASWNAASRRITPDRRPLDQSQRFNPSVAAKVTAAALRDAQNAIGSMIQQARVDMCVGLYMSHFLGLAGAQRFFRAYLQNPSQSACAVFTRECAANRNFMGNRTLAGLLQEAARRMGSSGQIQVAGNFETPNGVPFSQTNADIPANAYLPASTPIQPNTEHTYPTTYNQQGIPQLPPQSQLPISNTAPPYQQPVSQLLSGNNVAPLNQNAIPETAVVPAAAQIIIQPRIVSLGSTAVASWTSVGMRANSCRVTVISNGKEVLVGQDNEGTRQLQIGTNSTTGTLTFTMRCTTLTGTTIEKTATLTVL